MSRSRSLLGVPAWTWPLLTVGLVAAAALVPPPGPMADPPQAEALFRDPVLVAGIDGDGAGARVVPFGQPEGIGPLWAVNLSSEHWTDVGRRLRPPTDPGGAGLGFFRRRDRWHYGLTAMRYDVGARTAPPGTRWLPDAEAAGLRPLVIAELDRRAEGRGGELAALLDSGVRRESWICPQNALVLAAWLSIPLACWGVARTVHGTRPAAAAKLVNGG